MGYTAERILETGLAWYALLGEFIFIQEKNNIVALKEMVFHCVKIDEIWTKPKLRTCHEIIYEYWTENCVFYNLSIKEKNHFVLRLEEGYCLSVLRLDGTLGWKRICPVCDFKDIETSIILFYVVLLSRKSMRSCSIIQSLVSVW